MYRLLSIVCLVFLLTSCAASPIKINSDQKSIHKEHEVSCPVIESGKWHAWIDKFTQKKGNNRLIVVGEIVLPTPGFTIGWKQGATDRMSPPSLRLHLSATPPEGMVIQAITPVPVNINLETPIHEFRSVIIFCGNEKLAEITDVRLTD
jgi:hypothetical protein